MAVAGHLNEAISNLVPGVAGQPLWAPIFRVNSLELSAVPAQLESNMAEDYSPVFHDYDTSGLRYATRVSDYMCNPRVLADNVMATARPTEAATTHR